MVNVELTLRITHALFPFRQLLTDLFMLIKCIFVHGKHGKTHGNDLFGQIWLGGTSWPVRGFAM